MQQTVSGDLQDQLSAALTQLAHQKDVHRKDVKALEEQHEKRLLEMRNALQQAQLATSEEQAGRDEARRSWESQHQLLSAEVQAFKEKMKAEALQHSQQVRDLEANLEVCLLSSVC